MSLCMDIRLLLIPQRYEFSSKSQPAFNALCQPFSCCWYHKGTNFQANHNRIVLLCIYIYVVADTTKVRIFKQITTNQGNVFDDNMLLLIPQRYEFSSKSQQMAIYSVDGNSCCWYHKGTNFQANHNTIWLSAFFKEVVADTTKVRIFKQITTSSNARNWRPRLLLIPQRYEFSSKSQHLNTMPHVMGSCCWYHKGTNFQANHN